MAEYFKVISGHRANGTADGVSVHTLPEFIYRINKTIICAIYTSAAGAMNQFCGMLPDGRAMVEIHRGDKMMLVESQDNGHHRVTVYTLTEFIPDGESGGYNAKFEKYFSVVIEEISQVESKLFPFLPAMHRATRAMMTVRMNVVPEMPIFATSANRPQPQPTTIVNTSQPENVPDNDQADPIDPGRWDSLEL